MTQIKTPLVVHYPCENVDEWFFSCAFLQEDIMDFFFMSVVSVFQVSERFMKVGLGDLESH